MKNIALNGPFVKEGLTITLGFREFRNNCVSCLPVSVFVPSEFSWDALVTRLRNGLGRAIQMAAEAIFQPKVSDARPFIIVSRDGKNELNMELEAPESFLDRIEECITTLLREFAGVVFSSTAEVD